MLRRELAIGRNESAVYYRGKLYPVDQPYSDHSEGRRLPLN